MQQSKPVQPCLCAMISAVCMCLYSNSTWHCISMRRLISCSAAMLCDVKPSGFTSQNCNEWCLRSGWRSPQACRISQTPPAMSREPCSSSLQNAMAERSSSSGCPTAASLHFLELISIPLRPGLPACALQAELEGSPCILKGLPRLPLAL